MTVKANEKLNANLKAKAKVKAKAKGKSPRIASSAPCNVQKLWCFTRCFTWNGISGFLA